jgi:hypothetical protein
MNAFYYLLLKNEDVWEEKPNHVHAQVFEESGALQCIRLAS